MTVVCKCCGFVCHTTVCDRLSDYSDVRNGLYRGRAVMWELSKQAQDMVILGFVRVGQQGVVQAFCLRYRIRLRRPTQETRAVTRVGHYGSPQTIFREIPVDLGEKTDMCAVTVQEVQSVRPQPLVYAHNDL